MTYIEPQGVTLEDGQKLRHDEVWLVLDDGRVRELRLRVGRGIVRESDTGGWRPMGSAPRDGTAVLAAIEVWNRQGIPRAWWERHVVWCHDETGMIHPDADHGWEWDDYLHWHPLPAPPAREEP